jgi:hypothetical protein
MARYVARKYGHERCKAAAGMNRILLTSMVTLCALASAAGCDSKRNSGESDHDGGSDANDDSNIACVGQTRSPVDTGFGHCLFELSFKEGTGGHFSLAPQRIKTADTRIETIEVTFAQRPQVRAYSFDDVTTAEAGISFSDPFTHATSHSWSVLKEDETRFGTMTIEFTRVGEPLALEAADIYPYLEGKLTATLRSSKGKPDEVLFDVTFGEKR